MLTYLRTRETLGTREADQQLRQKIENDFPLNHIHYQNISRTAEYITHWNNHDYLSCYHVLNHSLHTKMECLKKLLKNDSSFTEASYQNTLIKLANTPFDNPYSVRFFYSALMQEVNADSGSAEFIQDLASAHGSEHPNMLHDLRFANYKLFERAFDSKNERFFATLIPLYQSHHFINQALDRLHKTWLISERIIYGEKENVCLLINCLPSDTLTSIMNVVFYLIYEQRSDILTALLTAYRKISDELPAHLASSIYVRSYWQNVCASYQQSLETTPKAIFS